MRDTVVTNRSIRRFKQDERVMAATLRKFVDLARQTASGANLQPLRYIIVSGPEACDRIFPNLAWAGYLRDWAGPEEGERPPAYIIVLSEGVLSTVSTYDPGIAAQTITLAAADQGIGACMLGAIDRKGIRKALEIPEGFDVLLVIALGWPAEEVILEDIGPDGDVKYWRDEKRVHHVPKRRLDDMIIAEH